MVIKHAKPPIALEIGSAKNTPLTPNPTIGKTNTSGATINAFLKRDGLKIIEGGIDITDAINYDAEQLYEKLLKEKQQQQSSEGNKGQQGQNQQNQNGQGNSGETPEDA